MKKIRIVLALVLASLAGILVWWFVHGKEFLYAGTLEATEVTLSAGVSSLVESYLVKEGEHVKKDQVLIRLEGKDLKVAADLAESEFKRSLQLLHDGTLTQAAFDKVKAQRDQAALLWSWCAIAAPRNGIVLATYHEAGEWVRPGVNLLTLGDLSDMWAYVYVAQPEVARLAPGQEVRGFLPELPGKIFSGRIASIRSEAEFTPKNVQTRDERTRLVYGVKVKFENPEEILKPGMSIEVKLGNGPGQ